MVVERHCLPVPQLFRLPMILISGAYATVHFVQILLTQQRNQD